MQRPEAIWLGLLAHDMVESAYYRGSSVPKEDRALWTASINGSAPIRARMGAGREVMVTPIDTRVESLSGFNLNIRLVAAMEIKASQLKRGSFKAGQSIELNTSMDTHFRAARYEWSGRFTLEGKGPFIPGVIPR